MVATREELIAILAALEQRIDGSITITRDVIDMHGRVVKTYRRTVLLNAHQEKP